MHAVWLLSKYQINHTFPFVRHENGAVLLSKPADKRVIRYVRYTFRVCRAKDEIFEFPTHCSATSVGSRSHLSTDENPARSLRKNLLSSFLNLKTNMLHLSSSSRVIQTVPGTVDRNICFPIEKRVLLLCFPTKCRSVITTIAET